MKVLQIGQRNWADEISQLPEDMEWLNCPSHELPQFLEVLEEKALANLPKVTLDEEVAKIRLRFDAVLITEEVNEADLSPLMDTIEAYGLYHDQGLHLISTQADGIFRRKVLRELIAQGSIEDKLNFLYLTLFDSQYGAKLKIPDIDVSPGFQGDISYDGHVAVNFSADFGEDFHPLFTFRYNLPSFPVALELWLEYVKVSGDSHIRLEITPMRKGSLHDVMPSVIFEERDMQEPFVLPPDPEVGFYAISVFAKGKGVLSFGPLHWRYSRMGLGKFVLGGERFNDSKRQELIYYFNPGDMKPPMNVYFSGFRPAEGFEGFGIMKSLKSPFMLIGDPRLEGGAFYIGSEEIENKVEEVIQESLDYLGFDARQLILSGLSMGTYGALYYASHFNPHGVVVGKPFTNLGDTATGMKLKRPDEFETIADVLRNNTGGLSEKDIESLNQKFWNKFSQSTFPRTRFAIAYMEHDDYDNTATKLLIEDLSAKGAHIYTKGYEGRHNDNSRSINKWFMRQYVDLLEADFERKYS
ncbi:accessory Sec system protein Asp2 [Streptococcus iniae]|uniref:accessory Sec system protein Asp2 n=1 Tax=Streptococcus iniae TaxID=1346 RepID=UPI002B313B61|nr:accessory Sec system protein Asp2 [Streptococcus iniae]WNZ90292.1 accessory Sec system protein Asp2 [Streptococcus iniae]WNZ91928.1 accessory Sec system protein Asp2 [Streptococcus iniae]WNZ93341.1 accessory Sec system protein Asp2 [Streptococcus iniae]WNZ94568.1 accessory Sec system protein Asp2 [Streptococcus iniae]